MSTPSPPSNSNGSAYAIATPSKRATDERLVSPELKRTANGRVQAHPDELFHPYRFAEAAASTSSTSASAAHLSRMQEATLLSRTFFLADNVQILQNALRRRVFDQTGTYVEEQNADQLGIVMRSIYLQYSTHRSDGDAIIRRQVHDMNERVLHYCVPVVVSSLKQYTQYRKDISSLPVPMEYGVCTSQAGSRSLKQAPFI
jgi:hypothetical protein